MAKKSAKISAPKSTPLLDAVNSTKVAIYIRVSTHWQIDKDSLPLQRNDLINYSKFILSTEDYVVFEDAGYSAKNTDRPDFQRMMSRVRTGEFSHILVWKIDRISRNLLDFAAMYQEIKDLGVIFVSKNEQFDTSTAIGEAMLKIILIFAELERNMTSERVSATMLSRASTGQWNGGRIAFGYDYNSETREFTPSEKEAPIATLMYDLYDEHHSLLVVSKILNERGFRARAGTPWSPVTVGNLMRNPFYIGTFRYNYRNENKNSFSYKPEAEWIMIEDHHPRLVTDDQWHRVVDTMYSQRRGIPGSGGTYNRGTIHIFSGLLTCGYCGNVMRSSQDRAREDGWRPSIYSCSRKRQFNDCPNKYISDITIGSFVLNFISNMMRAQKTFGASTSIETLEKKLLRGEALSDAIGIERTGLKVLYQHFCGLPDQFLPSPNFPSPDVPQERDQLVTSKNRAQRALDRLKALYLYSDEDRAMSETDYILEHKKLVDSLESTNARIKEIDSIAAKQSEFTDGTLISKASFFIISQQLDDKRNIDYESFVRRINPKIMKDFINSLCINFCIKSGHVTSISFKNGLTLQITYRDAN